MRFAHNHAELVLIELRDTKLEGLVTDDFSQLLRQADDGKAHQVVNPGEIALTCFRRCAGLDGLDKLVGGVGRFSGFGWFTVLGVHDDFLCIDRVD